jgi:adenosine/AMP kinase
MEIILVELHIQQGRAILGIVDGFKSKVVEAKAYNRERKQFLRKIGYKT